MSYLDTLFNLEGKTAVLVGAGGLVVGGLARGLAKCGVNVVLLDVNLERVQAFAEELKQQGAKALAIKVDITNKKDLQNALQKTIEVFGGVQILINGAGANAPTPFLDIPLEEWNNILSIQLTGTMLSCQVFGEYMCKCKKGSIINITSASSGPPLSKAFTYSVAKAGVKNLTQNLAREWALQGVRVNALRPGFFPSEFMKKHFLTEQRIKDILGHTPMKRFGVPEELVGAVLWLASDSSCFVTGAEVPVDGGFTAITI